MTTTAGDGKVARARVASPARADRWRRWVVVPVSGFLTALREPLRRPDEPLDRESRFVPVRPSSASPWSTPPPSLQALHRYTAGGEWIPGDRAPVLEFLGKSYGYLLNLPVHALAYALLWLVERPGRLTLAVIICAVLLWTAS